MYPSYAAYFFHKRWQDYRRNLHVHDGGCMKGYRVSPIVLWRNNLRGELLEREWAILLRDLALPDLLIELEAFTQYWQYRRRIHMKPGGHLMTTTGKRRELFTPTGRPRRLPGKPDTSQYDECISVSHAKYARMVDAHRRPSGLARFATTVLTKLGILRKKHSESGRLTSADVTILALSGTISGQIGGRSEVSWRRSRAFNRGAEDKARETPRLKTKHLLTGRRSLEQVIDHLLHWMSGWASRHAQLPSLNQ